MMRDHRGPTMFYLWSLATTALVIIGTRLDGGASSPLDALLFLTLTYMAVAYSPYGVVAMGTVMTGGYLLFVELPGLTTSGLFFLAVMVAFTLICAMASANSWAAYDRQVMLIRTQETLAATDPLTGIPNRRAFLERVAEAVDAAAWGHQTVVCLVDLDGFKARQRRRRSRRRRRDAHRRSGSALGGAVRETDTVARLGGDEFAVLADVSVGFSGEMLAERLREAVARRRLRVGRHGQRRRRRGGAGGRRRGPDAPCGRRDVPVEEPPAANRVTCSAPRPGRRPALSRPDTTAMITLRHGQASERCRAERPGQSQRCGRAGRLIPAKVGPVDASAGVVLWRLTSD